jgi:hypothetical protein
MNRPQSLALLVATVFFCCAGASAQNGNSDAAYISGLKLWRSPDLGNNSCSFCHSPDGIELARYNFDDATLLRRADPHFGARAPQIVAFIHSVRAKFNITKLLDPMTDRPLQPGGLVLPGASPAERDAAFGEELKKVIPTLASGQVDSLKDAEKAKDELMRVDLRDLRIGIPFNRISEDGFHGKEHATFAHWIADTPLQLRFPWPFFFSVQDNYLRDPSSKNLLGMVRFPRHDQGTNQLAQTMANDKYRALLIMQDSLRHPQAHGSVLFGWSAEAKLPNPLLELGLFADANAKVRFETFQFPPETLAKKTVGPAEEEQMKQIRLPSLWAGWIMDQGLERSDIATAPDATKVISERLIADGPYPVHNLFFLAKRLVTAEFAPQARAGKPRTRFDERALLMAGGDDVFSRKLRNNILRMNWFLSLDPVRIRK